MSLRKLKLPVNVPIKSDNSKKSSKKIREKRAIKISKKPSNKLKERIAVQIDNNEEMDYDNDFSPIEEQSPMQILNSLQDKENVEMQTEIQQPLNLTRLETLAKWCGDEKAFESQTTLTQFAKDFRVNMVSFNRQSRKEIITALTEALEDERRLSEKLMSAPVKEK
jgi:hypothetical protein